MEKLHQSVNVTADVFNFLGEMQDDLRQPRAMEDLRRGWQDYLETEMTSSGFGQHNLGKSSHSQRRKRNKTPTTSEEEREESALVCLLSLGYQHCDVHLMVPSCLGRAWEVRKVRARPATREFKDESTWAEPRFSFMRFQEQDQLATSSMELHYIRKYARLNSSHRV
jgi:hypothetical protein